MDNCWNEKVAGYIDFGAVSIVEINYLDKW
jgi:hypothetical protein